MEHPLLICAVQVMESIKAFIEEIIKHVKTKEHKLLKLLFAFHATVRYRLTLLSTSIDEAEKCFQLIEFLKENYEELRGKR